MPKSTYLDRPVTEKYFDEKLEEKLDKKLDEKLSKYATKKDLDRRSEEIVETVKDLFNAQNSILENIQEDIKAIRMDQRQHGIRLNDHEVRLESLE